MTRIQKTESALAGLSLERGRLRPCGHRKLRTALRI